MIVYKTFIPRKEKIFFSDRPSRNYYIVYVNGKIYYEGVEECGTCSPLTVEEALLLGAIRYYITLISDSPDFIFDIALRAARSEEDRMYKHHKKDEIING